MKRQEFLEQMGCKSGAQCEYETPDVVTHKDKVIVVCSKHGKYESGAGTLLKSRYRCKFCSGSCRYTKEAFIAEAISIHGNRYDYSKVEYSGSKSKVIIACPEHGCFEQIPNSHLQGNGCMKCVTDKQRSSTKDFTKKADLIHGGRYTYEKVKYTTASDRVVITCPIHGDFKQIASSHLSGSGCMKCVNRYKKYEEEAKQVILDNGFKEGVDFLHDKVIPTRKKHDRKFRPDFYFMDHNFIIEIDEKHHKRLKSYDIEKESYYQDDLGLTVFRIEAKNLRFVKKSINNILIEKILKKV